MPSEGPDHPELAFAVYGDANLRLSAGDLDGARAGFARSLRLLEGAHGVDAPTLVFPLGGLGEAQLRAGDTAGARATLERALPLLAEGSTPELHAHVRWYLAQALARDDDDRAAVLAGEARSFYAQLEMTQQVGEIDEFLAAPTR